MKIVDARGMACPKPVIEARKALQDIKGQELTVLIDNLIAVQNLERLGSYMNLETISKKEGEKEYAVRFLCSDEAAEAEITEGETKEDEKEKIQAAEQEAAAVQSCIPDIRAAGQVILISSDHMGEGDEVLGRLLMKGFLYALTELPRLPETVIFYNSGAKLSVEGSDSLEDIRHLEACGVDIMTCGTCLNHYEIGDKLAVGRVTNMYEITEKLMWASSVIKP
ncbi:sulfurtransferase-like selenium metabolism protein YedF [Lachnospiraceae bacterium 62-35]